jgi:hypothetical protein
LSWEIIYNKCTCENVGMYHYIKIKWCVMKAMGGGIVAVKLNDEIG